MNDAFRYLKWFLGLLLLLMLCLPLLQVQTRFIDQSPLEGHFEEVRTPRWSWDQCRQGEFQGLVDSFASVHSGFYPSLVRLHNQVQWNLFKRTQTQKVEVGRDNYLYETP